MEYTKNYHLPQWVETDRIMMEDFNQAMADIDAGIAMAKGAADTALSTADSAKATAESAAAFIAGSQNCRICTGSYVGSGTYGEGNALELSFPFYPLMVFIREISEDDSPPIICVRPSPVANSLSNARVYVTWDEYSMRWYSSDQSSHGNVRNYSYQYIALGYSKE